MILASFLSLFAHPLGQCAGASSNHLVAAHEIARCQSYNWVSGLGADISEITMLGIIVTVYKQHTCRAHWWCPCWAKHKVDGTTASVCHWHHTAENHLKLQRRHKRKYAHRLGHSQSTHPDTGAVVDLSNT
jgi:hypothetical protein